MSVIDDLVAYHSLAEASGNANDAHSGGLTLTAVGTPGSAAGKVGDARTFSGAGQYFSRGDDANFSLGSDTPFTWAGWVNSDLTIDSIGRAVLAKTSNGPSTGAAYQLWAPNFQAGFQFAVGNGSSSQTVSWVEVLAASTWFFVVIRHDPVANTIGISVNNGTEVTAAWSGGTQDEGNAFELGADTSWASPWDGLLDEWGFWKRKITDDDVTWLYNSGNGRSYADIVAEAGPAVDKAIWELDALTTPAAVDLLAIVDDPSGTPTSKKLAISDLISTLLVTNVVVQVKTVGSGTYTPTAGMKKVLVIGVGGGGGGAGGIATDSAGGGGGGGGTCIRLLTAAQIGVSKAYVVGAAGNGQTATGPNNATAGAATTIDTGTLLNAGGGGAATEGAQSAALGGTAAGGTGGTAANGDLNIPGSAGSTGTTYSGADGMGGNGGSSVLGFGGIVGGTNVAGATGQNYGGGGSGGHASGATNRDGANGAPGILYFIEFLAA